jgi:hypothetical protein
MPLQDVMLSLCNQMSSRSFSTQVERIMCSNHTPSLGHDCAAGSRRQSSCNTVKTSCHDTNDDATVMYTDPEGLVVSTNRFDCKAELLDSKSLSSTLESEIQRRQLAEHNINCLEGDLSRAMSKVGTACCTVY